MIPALRRRLSRQRFAVSSSTKNSNVHPGGRLADACSLSANSRGPRSEANAYRPGRYADLTGRGWENTSYPVLYQSGDGSSAVDMSVNPFRFAATSSLGNSAASRDSASNAEDTSARGPDASQESKQSPFLAPLIFYTPSPPLSQRRKVQEDQGEDSSVSEE